MPHRMFGRRRQAAFTILELLVVMVIAVLALAVAAPNFARGLTGIQLKSASRDVASALRYTRSQAIAGTRETEFFINVEEHIYRVTGRNKIYRLADELELTLFTAESEITGEDEGVIRFFPDGSSTGGRVTLEAGTRKRLVDVNWLTGQVSIRVDDEDD